MRVRIVTEHGKLLGALSRGAGEELVAHMDARRGASERDVVSVLTYPPGNPQATRHR